MTISFNKKIYSLCSVKKAISAYKSFANFSVSEKEKYINVCMNNIDEDIKDVILGEFCNYVLHEFIIDYKYEKN